MQPMCTMRSEPLHRSYSEADSRPSTQRLSDSEGLRCQLSHYPDLTCLLCSRTCVQCTATGGLTHTVVSVILWYGSLPSCVGFRMRAVSMTTYNGTDLNACIGKVVLALVIHASTPEWFTLRQYSAKGENVIGVAFLFGWIPSYTTFSSPDMRLGIMREVINPSLSRTMIPAFCSL